MITELMAIDNGSPGTPLLQSSTFCTESKRINLYSSSIVPTRAVIDINPKKTVPANTKILNNKTSKNNQPSSQPLP